MGQLVPRPAGRIERDVIITRRGKKKHVLRLRIDNGQNVDVAPRTRRDAAIRVNAAQIHDERLRHDLRNNRLDVHLDHVLHHGNPANVRRHPFVAFPFGNDADISLV